MSTVEVTYEIDLGGDPLGNLGTLKQRALLEIQRALDDIALFVESEAKSRAGFRTGNLRRNIIHDKASRTGPSTMEANVGVSHQAPYGIWHHEGTGIYGKHRRPITPTAGNVLVFRGSGGRFVFVKSVKGQRANPFMRDAFLLARNSYAPQRIRQLAHSIGNLA